jgi:hypothetical protein
MKVKLPTNISIKDIATIAGGAACFVGLIFAFPGYLFLLIGLVSGGLAIAEGIADAGEQGDSRQNILEKLKRKNFIIFAVAVAAMFLGAFLKTDVWFVSGLAVVAFLGMIGRGIANSGRQGSKEI